MDLIYRPGHPNQVATPSLVEDRRDASRVSFAQLVVCQNRTEHFLARALDLSSRGLSFRSNLGPASGSMVEVSFSLPGEGRFIRADAVVVRDQDPLSGRTWAVRFLELSPESHAALQSYMQRHVLLNGRA